MARANKTQEEDGGRKAGRSWPRELRLAMARAVVWDTLPLLTIDRQALREEDERTAKLALAIQVRGKLKDLAMRLVIGQTLVQHGSLHLQHGGWR